MAAKQNLTALLLLALGCNSPARLLVDRAVLQSVSGDQQRLAYFTGAAGMSGTVVGDLAVLDRMSQATLPIAQSAFNASFDANGGVLVFSTGVMVADDNAARAQYGALSIWTPELPAPVMLDAGLSVLDAMTPDRSVVVSFDAPLPHRSPQQSGKLWLAHAPTYAPAEIAAGEILTVALSPDGRFVAYVTHVYGATVADDRWLSWLYSIADQRTTMLASSAVSNLVVFSPDGALVGTASGALTLALFSTASGAQVPWSMPAAGTAVAQLAFSDGATLIARVRASGTQTIWRTTSTAATLLGTARDFAVPRVVDGNDRWLFASTLSAASATQDLQLYDLSQPSPAPLLLAATSNGPGAVTLSDDFTRARFFDAFDPNQLAGELTALDLPSLVPHSLAPTISNLTGGFLAGGATVYWLDSIGGNGALWSWNGGANVERAQSCLNFRSKPTPPALFVTLTAPDPLTGATGPGIWQLAP